MRSGEHIPKYTQLRRQSTTYPFHLLHETTSYTTLSNLWLTTTTNSWTGDRRAGFNVVPKRLPIY